MVMETVGHRRNLSHHRQAVPPFRRDSLNSIVSPGDLPVDCGGGVGVVPEVGGQKGSVTKVLRVVEGP